MVVMDALGVKLGFGFSAGLFDYVLNYGLDPAAAAAAGRRALSATYYVPSASHPASTSRSPGRRNEEPAPACPVAWRKGWARPRR
jgi:PTS system N-acetylglucosamine-specific IIC component